jgi:hypothetical protein
MHINSSALCLPWGDKHHFFLAISDVYLSTL